ncbi:unnamed protein product [Paramecium octaurelia]|uniref:Transmembrane protein n=1 Tax=Paramecium octaurelia TaxID=43137 RepID=A0A8S1TVT0_PAROT|nr:unnamed protein product [Paramecium octaurelia]
MKGFIQRFLRKLLGFVYYSVSYDLKHRIRISINDIYSICFFVLGVTIVIYLQNFKGMNENLKVSNLRFNSLKEQLYKKTSICRNITVQQSNGIIQSLFNFNLFNNFNRKFKRIYNQILPEQRKLKMFLI